MNCRVCGAVVAADEQKCSRCKEMGSEVQVLTPEEKQHFDGITLEQDQQEEEGRYKEQTNNANQQIYTRHFSISSTSLLTKLVLGIILLGIIFVALPIAILLISIVGIVTYILRK